MSLPEPWPVCPFCGDERVAWIIYGLVSVEELRADLDAGRVILGGCSVSEDSPEWRCRACGHEWGRPEILDIIDRFYHEQASRPSVWRRLRNWLGIGGDG
jgi:hypothetical protein